jgi:two-component sensor histidine kinase
MTSDLGRKANAVAADHDAATASQALREELDRVRLELEMAEINLSVARDRAALLHGELQHRLRNMLAITRSIFSRTVAASNSMDEIVDHFHGRLDALARYESAHVFDPEATIDLEQIVRDEFHGFLFGEDPRISIQGPEVRIGRDAAQAVALAMHELTTNSLKFGALSTVEGRGTVTVGWNIVEHRVAIEWVERGVSIVATAPLRKGFGREFIEQALPYQIEAMTSFQLKPGGIWCSITLPLMPVTTRLGIF